MHVNARAMIDREGAEGRELLIQTRNKPHEGGTWLELPGGRVEEFESLTSALRREVMEETGLQITSIEGEDFTVNSQREDTNVECLSPFAVYQTTRGPVDSIGFYFRCQAEGSLLEKGDDTLGPRWAPVKLLADWIKNRPQEFSWIDQAGITYYLQTVLARKD